MKCIILLAVVAFAAAQQRPPGNHHDILHNLIHQEVMQIRQDTPGISADQCADKCDSLFTMNAGHDEELTDKLCSEECNRDPTQHHTHPTHMPHHTRPHN